ncbi:hypothetical protein KV100_07540 [Mumia sp. zg.B21]|uniref:hypothetical protein n=1 Tax=Mumia sp. zg.B21 TaxID=2855447 RepID=UPI001C6E27EC|nr:hypothetical protein [Mumia sp. zg.B21]MBW9209505.1 hypothetical protein [Mumia sp. zg.B21]
MTDPHVVINVVRGEMQPWSDLESASAPAHGPLLIDLVVRASSGRTRALVVGPHGDDVLSAVAESVEHATVLLRSVTDAEHVASLALPGTRVVAGALDGLDEDGFDLVVAADGLERVLGADSPALSWPERLALLTRTATSDAALLVSVRNEFGLPSLFHTAVPRDRDGDDEWVPLYSDSDRPRSTTEVRAALAPRQANVFSIVSSGGAMVASVESGLASSRHGLGTRVLVDAVRSAAVGHAVLAPLGEIAERARDAGTLEIVVPAWLAVVGVPLPACAWMAGDNLLVAAADEGGWIAEASNGHRTSPLPEAPTAEALLFGHAESEDVPGFRAVAARLGELVRDEGALVSPVIWDAVLVGGVPVRAEPSVGGDLPADVALAAAWFRFLDRLLSQDRRHPWPPWTLGDGLVRIWLSMSGVADARDDVLVRGRETADALRTARGEPDPAVVTDLRTAAARVADLERELTEMHGHVLGLERTLTMRDGQLRAETARARKLKAKLATEQTRRRRAESSRAYRLARRLKNLRPRRTAPAASRRGDTLPPNDSR